MTFFAALTLAVAAGNHVELRCGAVLVALGTFAPRPRMTFDAEGMKRIGRLIAYLGGEFRQQILARSVSESPPRARIKQRTLQQRKRENLHVPPYAAIRSEVSS